VGIIGRNGAGKSTLLKLLARITPPTRGQITINGRVSSLLEVGTGFHPELTGRENVFLNGAIMGMNRREILAKFDTIVAFAEVEKFLDTPVKRYSSGMQMRLAFAVAAHLEPEILIVDEVLAVGDAAFQRRCFGKMEDVSQHGRTVLIVSHNMAAVTRLCKRAVLLRDGKVLADGPAHRVVDTYLDSGLGSIAQRRWDDPTRAPGNDVARLRAVRAITEDGTVAETFDIRKPIGVEMEFDVLQPGFVLIPNLHFTNEEGVLAFILSDTSREACKEPRPLGQYTCTVWFPGNFLAEGRLSVMARLSTVNPPIIHFSEPDALGFHVVDNMEGDTARVDYVGNYPGIVRPVFPWTTRMQSTLAMAAATT
jgi:lipopolysaccharide transport system ATP-binding protein